MALPRSLWLGDVRSSKDMTSELAIQAAVRRLEMSWLPQGSGAALGRRALQDLGFAPGFFFFYVAEVGHY